MISPNHPPKARTRELHSTPLIPEKDHTSPCLNLCALSKSLWDRYCTPNSTIIMYTSLFKKERWLSISHHSFSLITISPSIHTCQWTCGIQETRKNVMDSHRKQVSISLYSAVSVCMAIFHSLVNFYETFWQEDKVSQRYPCPVSGDSGRKWNGFGPGIWQAGMGSSLSQCQLVWSRHGSLCHDLSGVCNRIYSSKHRNRFFPLQPWLTGSHLDIPARRLVLLLYTKNTAAKKTNVSSKCETGKNHLRKKAIVARNSHWMWTV